MAFRFLLFFFPFLLMATPGDFGPWGKDSALYEIPVERTSQTPSFGLFFFSQLIRFHQNVISPVDGPRSHYRPTSSRYMLMAMQKYGVIKGFFMGCDRLMRENPEPWVYRTVVIDGKEYKQDLP